jgi:hypothetical protein
MNNLLCCKFFCLKEISFAVKGEMPRCVCKKGHDINSKCNMFCPDSDIIISPSRRFLFEDFIINKMNAAYLTMLANGHKIIASGFYKTTQIIISICTLLHLISKRIQPKIS